MGGIQPPRAVDRFDEFNTGTGHWAAQGPESILSAGYCHQNPHLVRIALAPVWSLPPWCSQLPLPLHSWHMAWDGQLKGFAVLEYETAEMAEEAQQRAGGLALGGSHLRVSSAPPGPRTQHAGRSRTAQATVSVCWGVGAPEEGHGGARS